MSYGIGIVVLEEDLNKNKIRWCDCDWTLPITVRLYPKSCKESFKIWYKEFEDEKKFTTLEKLQTSPCDCVCIINKEGDFKIMNRKNYKLSNEPNIEKYLTIK